MWLCNTYGHADCRVKRPKKEHRDPNLTLKPGLEIPPNPELVTIRLQNPPILEHRIPPILEVAKLEMQPVSELAPESEHQNLPIPSHVESSAPKKSYVRSVPCLVCCCFLPETVTLLDSSFQYISWVTIVVRCDIFTWVKPCNNFHLSQSRAELWHFLSGNLPEESWVLHLGDLSRAVTSLL